MAKREADHLQHRGDPANIAMHSAAQQVIAQACQHVAIPKRFSMPMREIWEFQLRLERRRGKRAAELVDHRRFRAAYDFLLLRESAGEETGGLGPWWTDFQTLPMDERLEVASKMSDGAEPRNRRRRGRNRTRTRRSNANQ